MRLKTILIASTLMLSIAGPASAHRQWMLPSTTTLSGVDESVSVDAAISNDLFYPDHFPMRTDGIKVWAPDGSPGAIENAATSRYRSIFDVKIDKAGTWKIGTSQSAVMGSFKVNGEEWRLGGRRGPGGPGAAAPAGAPKSVGTIEEIPANATDMKLAESSSRNEIFVTSGAPTTTVLAPTGKGLEFAPITHPDELVADQEAEFRFLVDGKPAANLKVTIVPGGKRYRDSEGAWDLTTGVDGVVKVKWPMAGMFWLNATATDNHPSNPKATERRMSYVSTLEVIAP